MITVFIADDHSLLRDGFKRLIDKQTDMTVVGEADNGMDLLDSLGETEPDVLVLDISMPGKNGVELLKDIHELKPKLKTLIFTMHPEERYAIRCLKAGAAGYLNKSEKPDNLIKAIQRVMEGRKYISENVAQQMAFELEEGTNNNGHEKLSDREYEVFIQIASGKSATEIADSLNIGKSTINTYRARVFNKMNIHNVAELVQYAIRNGLLD